MSALKIPIPRNYQEIEASDLAELVKKKESSLVIFDLRDHDYVGGHVPGSIHIPYNQVEDKTAQLAKDHGAKQWVVFYCQYGQLRSPNAALVFLKHLPSDNAGHVFVLSGGFFDYLKKYHKDTALVEAFDQACYNGEFFHINDTNQSSVRLRADLAKN